MCIDAVDAGTYVMTKRTFSVQRQVLSESQRQALVAGTMQSMYLGDSVLGKEFVQTRGFSLVFRRTGLDRVLQECPYLKDLMDVVLFDACNAFYVNPLVLQGNSRVDAHIDCRLVEGDIRIIPNLVSVFYAELAPDMVGGQLILNAGESDEIELSPKAGDLVHFLGSTIHRVEPVRSRHRRISFVCEQYHLDDQVLEGFPVCQVLASTRVHPESNGRINGLEATAQS